MAARQPADFRADYPVGATHRDASIILHRNYALADYGIVERCRGDYRYRCCRRLRYEMSHSSGTHPD